MCVCCNAEEGSHSIEGGCYNAEGDSVMLREDALVVPRGDATMLRELSAMLTMPRGGAVM